MQFQDLLTAATEFADRARRPQLRTALEHELEVAQARRVRLAAAIECSRSGQVLPDLACPGCFVQGQSVLTIPQGGLDLGRYKCCLCRTLYDAPPDVSL